MKVAYALFGLGKLLLGDAHRIKPTLLGFAPRLAVTPVDRLEILLLRLVPPIYPPAIDSESGPILNVSTPSLRFTFSTARCRRTETCAKISFLIMKFWAH